MVWLEQNTAGIYRLIFRLGGERFRRSLRTSDERDAEARRVRLEENIRLVESGRLTLPEQGDIAAFLLSDGKLNGKPKAPRRLPIGELIARYREALPSDALEPESLRIAAKPLPFFPKQRIVPKGVLYGEDHYNLLPFVLAGFRVDQALYGGQPSEYDTASFNEWLLGLGIAR